MYTHMYMYMYMYICMCVYIYIYIYMYAYVSLLYTYIYIYISRVWWIVAFELCYSYPCPCPSQFVEHLQTPNGYSVKFVELFWAGVWV